MSIGSIDMGGQWEGSIAACGQSPAALSVVVESAYLKKSGLPYPITRIFDYFGLDTFTYTHCHTHVRQFIPCLTKLHQTKSGDSPNCRQTWHGALVPRPRPKSAGERPWRSLMLDRSQGFSPSETSVIFSDSKIG